MSIRALFFDVGGVLLHETNQDKRREWEARLGLGQGELRQIVFSSPSAAQAPTGGVDEQVVWQEVGQRLGLGQDQLAQLQRDFWAVEELDAELVPFIQCLRPRYKVGIISNAWSGARLAHNSKFNLNTWSDGAIYSAEVKLVKPDPRIYQLALEQLSVRADESVFVDDALANVQAAEALGMKGVHCTTAAQAIRDIQRSLDITNV